MVSLTGKRKIIAIALVFAVVFPAFIALGVFPFLKGVAADAQDLSKKRRDLATLEDEVRNQAEFSQYSLDRAPDFQKLSSLFLDPGNPTQFLKALEDSALQSGLFSSVVPGNAQKVQGDIWPSIEFKLSFKSSYASLLAFLRRLESIPYLLEIRNLTVVQEQGQLGITLSLKVYTK